jgi:DNA modification methylase
VIVSLVTTDLGRTVLGDSLEGLRGLADQSVDLVVTSPPYALTRKKSYGNVSHADYVGWLLPWGREIFRVLRDTGSFVLNLGWSWNSGTPTRSLHSVRVLLSLCEEIGFHLAQEFYWSNPACLPSPAEWVTIRRIRVGSSGEPVWWLSRTPWPKADNRRVLRPYSESMQSKRKNRYFNLGLRPSGHDVTGDWGVDHGGSIPTNLVVAANTASNTPYHVYCREKSLTPHPARFPEVLPEFFIRLLTDRDDLVVDPFAGSCTVGAVAERLGRRWLCYEVVPEYLEGAVGRFPVVQDDTHETPETLMTGRDHVPAGVVRRKPELPVL